MWAMIGTWPFSLKAIEAAHAIVKSGGDPMDAAVEAVRLVEDDLEVDSVGTGGRLNWDGKLELDAAVMDGTAMSLGGVAALKGFKNPVLVARSVMEHTPHTLLAGAGAEQYAREAGFAPFFGITKERLDQWARERAEHKISGHDTVGVLAMLDGRLRAATSTSGLAMKHPGRVGDTPLAGSGLYADDEMGAAAATGVGEDIMRGATCFYAVECMKAGMSPQQAAEAAIRRTHDRLVRTGRTPGNMAVVCMNPSGEFGGAANHDHFAYAAASERVAPRLYAVRTLYPAQ